MQPVSQFELSGRADILGHGTDDFVTLIVLDRLLETTRVLDTSREAILGKFEDRR
jgi:hypothetical protein